MIKSLNALLVIGIILLLGSAYLRVMGVHDIGMKFTIAGAIVLSFSMLLSRSARSKQGNILTVQYNERYNKVRRMSNSIMLSGTIIVMFGLLLKIAHFYAGTYLIEGGLVIVIISFALLFILIAGSKQYFVKSGQQVTPVDTNALQESCGTYFSDEINEQLSVYTENGALQARLGTQAAIKLSAIRENVFNNIVYGTVVEFKPATNELVLVVNGRYLVFVKQ